MTHMSTEAELNLGKDALQEAREYEVKQKREENEILNMRMEYGHLMSGYMSLVNMFWVGYGAFFTINSLFATALGVSYSQNAQSMSPSFLFLVHLLIPMAGMFISACAIYAAILITTNLILVATRGRELEVKLRSEIFRRMHIHKFPGWTTVGALFFAALWLTTLFAISPWPSLSCDKASKEVLQIRILCN